MHHIKVYFLILTVLSIFALSFHTDAVALESCDEWIAKAVSVQGEVHARTKDENQWTPVEMNNTFCSGDMLRVQKKSRAAIVLINDTIIRLDQNTTITFTQVEKKKTSILDIITGAVHFISRVPRTLKVSTPFVNGNVEGTEFLVRVFKDNTVMTVYEGRVLAANESGSLILRGYQSALAESGKAPVLKTVVRPGDVVQWALYYPPVLYVRTLDYSDAETGWRAAVKESSQHFWKGDIANAFSSIQSITAEVSDPDFYTYRASLLLSVGRVDEALNEITRALKIQTDNSDALALQSIIAVVQNEKGKAIGLANKAIEADPDSATAHIALSYAEQAHFNLKASLKSLQKAVKLDPENGLAWARLSEMWLSFGNLDNSLDAAKEAVKLNPELARTQTVLGYSHLYQIKTGKAITNFDKAITLDQADPLPRLGLGLAQIREGKLKEGRENMEIAASLDPNNSLIRSYMGKAYYEEKRDKLAEDQYDMAQSLDPEDPTSFFYDAIRKQSINRPVEALHDLQKAIELNDNRAIYRSKLLLDDDLAARSASLARVYSDLGFQQLALVEGWKSVNIDPGNYSAHRFLADTYSILPRHEIARVSELLQSQLLQPVNITPVQPSLAEANLLILNSAEPGSLSFNEFNPIFNRNQTSLQVSSVTGNNDTYGHEATVSGVYDKFSISVGQFLYNTDGFRENNDLEQNIHNIYAQARLTHKTSIQTEYRHKDVEKGDLPLFVDPNDFLQDLREDDETDSIRFGFHHSFKPDSNIIASFIYQDLDIDVNQTDYKLEQDEDGYIAEAQYLFTTDQLKITVGAGYSSSDLKDVTTITFIIDPFLPPITDITTDESDVRHTNIYVYSQINYLKNITLTIGGSADFFDGGFVDSDQFNPKFGLTWNVLPDTTLRAAAFRTLKRTLLSDQTLEPTQVAGFNQFFDDGEGTDSWRYGLGIDHKVSDKIYGGAEFSKRDLTEPGDFFDEVIMDLIVKEFDVDEQLGRAYVYWTPYSWLALSTEYQFERFDNPEEFLKDNRSELKMHRYIFGIGFFHPSGFSAQFRPNYIAQEGEFQVIEDGPFGPSLTIKHGEDKFWVFDASINYRLPKRYGIISLEARNLFDEEFRFQDTDPSNPTIYPERLILAKFTLAF